MWHKTESSEKEEEKKLLCRIREETDFILNFVFVLKSENKKNCFFSKLGERHDVQLLVVMLGS